MPVTNLPPVRPADVSRLPRRPRRSLMQFDLIVEIPAGSRNNYEMDHARGMIPWTAPCSPPPATRPTTATSTTPSPPTATPSTPSC